MATRTHVQSEADTAVMAALTALGISSEAEHMGGGCTAVVVHSTSTGQVHAVSEGRYVATYASQAAWDSVEGVCNEPTEEATAGTPADAASWVAERVL